MQTIVRLTVILTFLSSNVMSECHVMKRSDDSNPLEAVVSKLTQDVTTLEAKIQALENSAAQKAAFHGMMVKADPIVAKAPIKFTVNHQVGGGYDAVTGVYTAPYSGWYTFHARLFPLSAAIFYFDLYQNGNVVSRYRCEDEDDYFTCSSSVTLHVSAGDRLWLQADNYNQGCAYATFDNVFSLVLVLPD